ncbi:MAG: TraR/DksA C4-type zinc finger protein [Burkholderiales bacterium]|nr:TraR/DksA C4-type zinc finger protein [Burkholderiales bacterium]PZN02233.1 MAG: hypothetical protein DIU74_08345 [Pseudomonadota bacterium]
MLSEKELKEIERGLRERYKTLLEEVREKLRAARVPTGSDQADALIEEGDMALADLLSHTSMLEGQRDVQELQSIEGALERIKDGSFGTCVHCGNEIERPRLKVHPTAVRCMRCQEDYERTYAGTVTPTL